MWTGYLPSTYEIFIFLAHWSICVPGKFVGKRKKSRDPPLPLRALRGGRMTPKDELALLSSDFQNSVFRMQKPENSMQ